MPLPLRTQEIDSFGSRIAPPIWQSPREYFMLPSVCCESISLAGMAHMNSTPTRAQLLVVVTLIGGITCLVLVAVTAVVLAGGWMVNWLIPSLPFEYASIITGISLTIATILFYSVAKILSQFIAPSRHMLQDVDDEDEDDDDDYAFDEEMAERIAELTIAKLTRPPAPKKYSAKARQK